MKKNIALAALALLIISCAHGKTEHFPTWTDPSEAAEVFIIRNNNLAGLGFSLKVVFDDQTIARLRAGEHIHFFAQPGFHSLGISEPEQTVAFEKGHRYYFLISADYTQFGFEIERIGDLKGESWIGKTKRVE
jgi:hypothetical protein